MNLFLQKNLSLVNKNNIINIKFGKKISQNIFETKILNNKITENIIQNLKKDTKFKIINNLVLEFNYLDNVILKQNNKLLGFKHEVSNIISEKKTMFAIIKIKSDNQILECPEDYNLISKYHKTIINIQSVLEIIIKKYQNYLTIDIEIKKPCQELFVKKYIKLVESIL